ncbi:MAG: hypothetical protein NT018_03375 [Armatimonadetes bacterium]|nr:hypothetical protein [Armatimonadota bacterium]
MLRQAFSAEARLAFWLHATVGFSFGSKSEAEASETPHNLLPASCRLLQACLDAAGMAIRDNAAKSIKHQFPLFSALFP